MKKKEILLTSKCPDRADIQLGLYYLKSYFVKYSSLNKSVNIDILSFGPEESISSMVRKIEICKPLIVGFSCYVWNITEILKVAKLLKYKMPNIKIVLGGPEASPRAYQLLRYYRFIDAVVIGEGERTFKELLECWLNETSDIGRVKGIGYHKGQRIIITEDRSPIENLNEIPSSYLEGIIKVRDIKRYGRIMPYMPLETMRGCIYKCHYCYYHKDFPNLRYFSLDRIEKELKFLLKKEPRGIYLMDATFNINKKRSKEILRLFIKYNKKTNLHLELRAELLDKEMIGLLKKARTDFIEIGLQSTNPKALKRINRYFQPNLFVKNVVLMNREKLSNEIQLIDGLPGDNYNSLKESVDWLIKLRVDSIKIMRLRLLPGTHLRQNAKQFKIKYNHRPPYLSTESQTFSSEDIKKTWALRNAISSLYNRGMLKNSLYFFSKKIRINFSDIFEEWNDWVKKSYRKPLRIFEMGLNEDNKVERKVVFGMVLSKLADMLSDFVGYLCSKYNKQHEFKSLLKYVQKDARRFLESCGINRERM